MKIQLIENSEAPSKRTMMNKREHGETSSCFNPVKAEMLLSQENCILQKLSHLPFPLLFIDLYLRMLQPVFYCGAHEPFPEISRIQSSNPCPLTSSQKIATSISILPKSQHDKAFLRMRKELILLPQPIH